MNKEVEEAKEILKHLAEHAESVLLDEEGLAINKILNYIKELEESMHKERELAEAQTTYEVNEMWKEKIENKIEEVNNDTERDMLDIREVLQELLNEEE